MHHQPLPALLLATIDLGSNSFRLEISRYIHSGSDECTERLHYLKEIVRQGNGLDADGNLTPEAMQRGWDCLARFGACLAEFPSIRVRAIATQTLREAHNRAVFLQHGAALLGYPIEVLSGEQEARLVYQGVAQQLPASDERRLVLDIGGRSTELIVGQHANALASTSFAVGSVAWSMRYFADGSLSATAFALAVASAKTALAPALPIYHHTAWDVAYGSCGTMTAASDILGAAGRSPDCISRSDLEWLQTQLLQAHNTPSIHHALDKENRRPIIGGGISVLRAIYELLDIERLHVIKGALRQGVLFELLAHAATT